MKIQKLFLPFALLVIVITLRLSSDINNETYYDDFKEKFTSEIDIISLSKKFLGKMQYIYFEEQDYNVSSNEDKTQLSDGSYFVSTDSRYLVSKSNGVCVEIKKVDFSYTIKFSCEGYSVIYYDVLKPNVTLYQYVDANDIIGELNYDYSYYYRVSYEG